MDEHIISLFVLIAGYIIGLGAVTVIDLHGFLGRKSKYWTRATISAHKVTKPLIWIGTLLNLIGTVWFYSLYGVNTISILHWIIISLLMLNGLFLTFHVSPLLLLKEKEGRSEELLPTNLQHKIMISFIVSFFGWWGSLLLFSYYVVSLLRLYVL